MVRAGKVAAKAALDIEADLRPRRIFQAGKSAEIIRLIPLGLITHPRKLAVIPNTKAHRTKIPTGDGMPDDWEKQHGLNPNDPSDASSDLTATVTPTSKTSSMVLTQRRSEWTGLILRTTWTRATSP